MTYLKISNIMRTKSKNAICFSSRFAVVFAQHIGGISCIATSLLIYGVIRIHSVDYAIITLMVGIELEGDAISTLMVAHRINYSTSDYCECNSIKFGWGNHIFSSPWIHCIKYVGFPSLWVLWLDKMHIMINSDIMTVHIGISIANCWYTCYMEGNAFLKP